MLAALAAICILFPASPASAAKIDITPAISLDQVYDSNVFNTNGNAIFQNFIYFLVKFCVSVFQEKRRCFVKRPIVNFFLHFETRKPATKKSIEK